MKGRFLFLTDTHWAPEPRDPPRSALWQRELFDTHPQRLEEMFVELVENVSPDFVIHGGDLCRDVGGEQQWRNAKRILDRIGCPVHFVAGNHDCRKDDQHAAMAGALGVPERQLFFHRRIGGLDFIFLDSSYFWSAAGAQVAMAEVNHASFKSKTNGVTPQQIEWLSQLLQGPCAEAPSVVVTHVPLIAKAGCPVRYLKGRPIADHIPGWDDRWLLDVHGLRIIPLELRRAELLHVMRTRGDVRLVLAGHIHASNISVLDGIVHCTTSSMTAWPFEARLIEFDDDGLRIETIQAGAPDLIEASHVPEWGNDWVAGTSEKDRQASIRWDDVT